MLSGIVITGAVLSMIVWAIVTLKLPAPLFPAASDAIHVTVVVPIENIVPDAGVHVGPVVTAMLSVAVTPV